MQLISWIVLSLALVACGTQGAPGTSGSRKSPGKADDGSTPAFQSLFDYSYRRSVNREEAVEKLKRGLVDGFDNICGDTFCEGDYANLTSLGFDCSVETATAMIRSCTWTFAGSYSIVDATTGEISISSQTFPCGFLQGGNMSVDELLALADDRAGPLDAALDEEGRTIYDALVECF